MIQKLKTSSVCLLLVLGCIAAVTIATVVGTKTTQSNVVSANLTNIQPLSDIDIIDSVDIISLQNTDKWIQKIDKVAEFDSLLYIMDRKSKALHVFTQSGSYISTISNVGHAANEYIEIDDFFVDDQDSTINILSGLDKKIFKYTANGSKLLSVQPVPMSFRRIIKYDGGYVGFMGNSIENTSAAHNFFVMDNDFQVLSSYIDIDSNHEGIFHGDVSIFARYGNSLYFFSDSSREIYGIDDISSAPSLKYQLDCGDANAPQLNENDNSDWQRMLEISNKCVMDINYFLETDDYLLFYYLYQGSYCLTVQEKSNHDTKTYRLDVYAGDYFFEFGRVVGMTKDVVYTSVEAQSVYYPWKGSIGSMNYEQDYPQQVSNIRRKFSNINSDGNPFVVKYYMKD